MGKVINTIVVTNGNRTTVITYNIYKYFITP